MTLKEQILLECKNLLLSKIQIETNQLNDLLESTRNETKSSAGDKYETGRAMLQIEQDNTRARLRALAVQQAALNQLSSGTGNICVMAGSLVKTNRGHFFISVALGKLMVDGQQVVTISANSPLGQKLTGMKLLEEVVVNGITYRVESIS